MKVYSLIFFFVTTALLSSTIDSSAQTLESSNKTLTVEQLALFTEYSSHGDDLYDEGNYEEAITYYDKALEIDPTDLVTLFSKGLALDSLGKTEEAITYYDKVLALDPNDIDSLYNKGLALDHLDKIEEAITYYDKVLALDPNDIDALFSKGHALDDLGKTEDAITYYDKVLALDPNDIDSLYNKGHALDDLGKTEEAVLYYNRVLAIDPNDADALNRLNITSNIITKYVPALTQDQTLLVIVGAFVSLLVVIIIINLAIRKSHAPKEQILPKTNQAKSDEDKKIESKDADDEWKGI